jgi:ubiquinone/menaquinone biosynthesis C-methylase UbiE
MITSSGFIKRLLLEKVFATFLRSPGVIVDVGCSGAAISAHLNVELKIALDLSLNFNPKMRKNVHGIEADASFLPFKDNTIDCIICLDVIEHIENDKKLLQEFYRTLKEEGFLIISTPFKNIEYMPLGFMRRLLKLDAKTLNEEFGHVRPGYTYEELKKLLESNNFNIIYYETFGGSLTRLMDLLIYRPLFKFYMRGRPFVETYTQRRKMRRTKIVNFLENVHDTFLPVFIGPLIKNAERIGFKTEHFIVCQKGSKCE